MKSRKTDEGGKLSKNDKAHEEQEIRRKTGNPVKNGKAHEERETQ